MVRCRGLIRQTQAPFLVKKTIDVVLCFLPHYSKKYVMSSCPIVNDGDELRGSGRSSVTPLFQHLISHWLIIVANARGSLFQSIISLRVTKQWFSNSVNSAVNSYELSINFFLLDNYTLKYSSYRKDSRILPPCLSVSSP